MKKLEAVNKYISNIELEKGEILQRLEDDYSQIIEIGGKPHSKGGTPVQLTKNDRVFSNKIVLPESIVSALINKEKKYTPADLAKEYNPEKWQELLDHSDPLTRNSAKLMKAKYDAILDSVFAAQELFKDSKGVKDGVLLKDQGLDNNLNKVGAMGGTYKGDPGVNPNKRKLLGFSAFGKPVPIATYDDNNAYLSIYKSPDKFRKNPDGTPVNKEYWNQTKDGWFTKPQFNNEIISHYADRTGFDLKSNTYNRDPLSILKRRSLVERPNKDETKTYNKGYIPTAGTYDASGKFVPSSRYDVDSKPYADPLLQSLPQFSDKDKANPNRDYQFLSAKGKKVVPNAFASVNNVGEYDDLQDGEYAIPITQPTANGKTVPTGKSTADNGVVNPIPANNRDPKRDYLNINPQRVADKTNSAKDPMSELIGFRDQQRFAQANLIQSILGQVAPPVYTNPQETAIAQRYLPVNDLAAERAVNNARDTMMNSDMPSQITNALSGDLVSKAIEGTGKIDTQNSQGYLENQNRNNANLQNVLYKNSVNSAKAKEDYVRNWQMALDQHDKEVQDSLYNVQDIELQKGQTQDQATMQEHLYKAAGKRFIPRAKVNKNGTVSYQYVLNPDWTPQDQTNRWFANQDNEIDNVMRRLSGYTPEQQKLYLEFIKARNKNSDSSELKTQ